MLPSRRARKPNGRQRDALASCLRRLLGVCLRVEGRRLGLEVVAVARSAVSTPRRTITSGVTRIPGFLPPLR